MKSTGENLRKRGYTDDIDTSTYSNLSIDELYQLLNSKYAFERTIAIRLLANNIDINDIKFVATLIEKLSKEKALYTKIEICNVLEKGNKNTCRMMINYLGTIGNNQHNQVPLKVSQKISYPLPRDIVARTLGKMNSGNIDVLLEVLTNNDLSKISEILDAIGFMIFYNQELDTIDNFNIIKNTLNKYKENDLIVWKCILCLSAFKLEDNKKYLNSLKTSITNKSILLEIDRSLKLIAV